MIRAARFAAVLGTPARLNPDRVAQRAASTEGGEG